jgi:NADPH2:quinone reductase
MRALTFDRFGGPEVLGWNEVPDPDAVEGTAVVRMRAVGLNFADVYRRRGAYHLEGKPPWVLGYEGAGVIESITPSVAGALGLAVGSRVAFADVPHANAELVRAPLSHLIPLPSTVSFEVAAALLLQGLTAHYLVNDSHRLASGEVAAVHAAAGGVGHLLVQLAKRKGARVFALVSSEAKADAARLAGADEVALYSQNWVERVRSFTPRGTGADVVFDSVGATLAASLDAVRKGGHVVFYGMAGGDPALVDPRRLMDESKSLTGGDLWNVLTSHEERVRRSQELFDLVSTGTLRVDVSHTFPLSQGATAHALLESRGTVGKILLLPDGR